MDLTGKTLAIRLRKTAWAIVSSRVDTPMITTERGANINVYDEIKAHPLIDHTEFSEPFGPRLR